jgi:hypothetical protein
MYNCFIKLVIASIDMTNGEVYILSTKENKFELPTCSLDSNIEDLKRKLFEKNVNLGSNWASIRLIKPFIDMENLYLYYLTKIPHDTLINGFWLKSTICLSIDNNIKECIRYV